MAVIAAGRSRAGRFGGVLADVGREAGSAASHMSTLPAGARGAASRGRIIKLMIGQAYGFIRLTDHREVFFHRNDLEEGTAFNDLTVGDPVTFALVEDPISGARAQNVHRTG